MAREAGAGGPAHSPFLDHNRWQRVAPCSPAAAANSTQSTARIPRCGVRWMWSLKRWSSSGPLPCRHWPQHRNQPCRGSTQRALLGDW